MLLAWFIFTLTACGGRENVNIQYSSSGGAIVTTIKAEVIEIISDNSLYVKVIEPAQVFDNNANVLLPDVFATIIYDEDIDWISDVINTMVNAGSIIEFGRGINLGSRDFLQEPFEVRGINIRIFDVDDNSIFERGF
jgi:hypothetical protein